MENVQVEISSFVLKTNRVNVIADNKKQAIQILKSVDPELDIIMVEYHCPIELHLNSQNMFFVNKNTIASQGTVMLGEYQESGKELKVLANIDIANLPELDSKGKEELSDAEMFCGDFQP
jgi:hypothetical protein